MGNCVGRIWYAFEKDTKATPKARNVKVVDPGDMSEGIAVAHKRPGNVVRMPEKELRRLAKLLDATGPWHEAKVITNMRNDRFGAHETFELEDTDEHSARYFGKAASDDTVWAHCEAGAMHRARLAISEPFTRVSGVY